MRSIQRTNGPTTTRSNIVDLHISSPFIDLQAVINGTSFGDQKTLFAKLSQYSRMESLTQL